jgi:hypothetical protein
MSKREGDGMRSRPARSPASHVSRHPLPRPRPCLDDDTRALPASSAALLASELTHTSLRHRHPTLPPPFRLPPIMSSVVVDDSIPSTPQLERRRSNSTSTSSSIDSESSDFNPDQGRGQLLTVRDYLLEILKLLAYGTIFYTMISIGSKVGALLFKLEWRQWPLGYLISGIVITQVMRQSFPPLYLLLGPFNLLVSLALSTQFVNPYVAALVNQVLKLVGGIIVFWILRCLYSSSHGKTKEYDQVKWYHSITLTHIITWFEEVWSSQLPSPSPHPNSRDVSWQPLFLIVPMVSALYFDSYLILLWMATRSTLKISHFARFYIVALGINFFVAVFRMKIMEEEGEHDDDDSSMPTSGGWFESLSFPQNVNYLDHILPSSTSSNSTRHWYNALPFLLITITSTLYFYALHFHALYLTIQYHYRVWGVKNRFRSWEYYGEEEEGGRNDDDYASRDDDEHLRCIE